MDHMQDNDLVARCITGKDEAAWELFVRKYSRLIWGAVHKTFRSYSRSYGREDLEDAFSAIFLSLLEDDSRKLRVFEARNACSLSTWLAVVSVNHTVDYLRKHKRRIESSIDDADGPEGQIAEIMDLRPGIESALIEKQQQGALAEAVAGLPEQDREVYHLLFDQGQAPETAAKALDISLPALYTRKNRLLVKIKKILPQPLEFADEQFTFTGV